MLYAIYFLYLTACTPLQPLTPPLLKGHYIYLIKALLFSSAAQKGQSSSLSEHISISTYIGIKKKVASVKIIAYTFVLVQYSLAVIWPQATHTHALLAWPGNYVAASHIYACPTHRPTHMPPHMTHTLYIQPYAQPVRTTQT